KGSAGTHNGLKSIIYHLQRNDFPRIKIGVGSPPPEWDLADFVLSRFQNKEEKIIKESIEVACESIETIIKEDIDKAMNKFN
ncbi:aminoacyl-tRNA hydrolase, partial [Anaerosalibacter bizertensis]|nr:aminoacyl-tRNA hydrolase [Anaerosalibacter bizertensis]